MKFQEWTSLMVVTLLGCSTLTVTTNAQAQTLRVLHTFTRQSDGAGPVAGLTADRVGNLYGTAAADGDGGFGTVFKLTRLNNAWIFSILYGFSDLTDGGEPFAGVTIGQDGTVYGTTYLGVGGNGGTVFRLRPSPTFCPSVSCLWSETVIHAFEGSDGYQPFAAVVFDPSGNLYGTTFGGGQYDAGAVFELTPAGSGWTYQLIYSFDPFSGEGVGPETGVTLDAAGNLYGTTNQGGAHNCGDVYELRHSGSGWARMPVYEFQCATDGGSPFGGLIFDQSGNIFGTTALYGSGGGGTVFELTPSNGGWAFNLIHSFAGSGGPTGQLVMDGQGNLYGTTFADGGPSMDGSIFELLRSNGGWAYTPLYEFAGGSDGASPHGNIIRDATGNLYGTANGGGADNGGVVWQLTP